MIRIAMRIEGLLVGWTSALGSAWAYLRDLRALRPEWSLGLGEETYASTPVPLWTHAGPRVVSCDGGVLTVGAIEAGRADQEVRMTRLVVAESVHVFDAVTDGRFLWIGAVREGALSAYRVHVESSAVAALEVDDQADVTQLAVAALDGGVALLHGMVDARLGVLCVDRDMNLARSVRHPLSAPLRHLAAFGARDVALALLCDPGQLDIALLGIDGRLKERPHRAIEGVLDQRPEVVWMDDGFAVFGQTEAGLVWKRFDRPNTGIVEGARAGAAAHFHGTLVGAQMRSEGIEDRLTLSMQEVSGRGGQVHTLGLAPGEFRVRQRREDAAAILGRLVAMFDRTSYRETALHGVQTERDEVSIALPLEDGDALLVVVWACAESVVVRVSRGVAPHEGMSLLRLARWVRERRARKIEAAASRTWAQGCLEGIDGAELLGAERRATFRWLEFRGKGCPAATALRDLLRRFDADSDTSG